jgi:hypothetical protein
MSSAPVPVTLQVSLTPTDYEHARHILPHQLRQWSSQVDEILLVVDLVPSAGRFGANAEKYRPALIGLLDETCGSHRSARWIPVDYGQAARRNVRNAFMPRSWSMPKKDYLGGPFYSYLFALHQAAKDYVFHIDSDMMFGGGSKTWMAEAVELLSKRDDLLVASVLPGPPTADGHLTTQIGVRDEQAHLGYRFPHFTSRDFVMSRAKYSDSIGSLRPSLVLRPRREVLRAVGRHRRIPYQLPEVLLSRAMSRSNLQRLNFLGSSPGMWSLHPDDRSGDFHRLLPIIIRRIEQDRIPPAQRGDYDVNESFLAAARLDTGA